MNVKEFELVNEEKVERALIGTLGRGGELKGGVQAADGSFDDDALLAEYDRLGGLILKDKDKVKTGSFFDFKARAPRKEAQVVLEFRVNGRVVEVAAEEPLPMIVKAAKVAEEQAAEEVEEKAAKRAAKKTK